MVSRSLQKCKGQKLIFESQVLQSLESIRMKPLSKLRSKPLRLCSSGSRLIEH
jgi:hypothetical protein